MVLPSSLRSYLNEPAVPDPPARVGRDWWLVGAAAVIGVLEAALRTDAEWVAFPVGWRVASAVVFLATLPTLLIRRTHPLVATVVAFGVTMAFGVAGSLATGGGLAGLTTGAVMLVTAYSLYRWGSGRDGAIGAVVLLVVLVVGMWTDSNGAADVIGGTIVLCAPVEIGLLVRYRQVAQERAIAEATSRERTELARELHDTIAHHVSAIAVQAQAGRAVAAADPERALAVLAVIEDTAKEALGEMRTMVAHVAGRGRRRAHPPPGPGRPGPARPGPAGRPAGRGRGRRRPGPGRPGGGNRRVPHRPGVGHQRHPPRPPGHPGGGTGGPPRRPGASHGGRRRSRRRPGRADGGPVGADSDGFGYGLIGMAERAHLLGGQLTAGPDAGGRWLVTADLPASTTDGAGVPA